MSAEMNATVKVRDAYKRYSPKAVVLNGLNMTVNDGHIYGLLGPSGCGKTSLLNCIVGLNTFDSGTISLSVSRKIELGYMPQEVSLNTEFTVKEELYFYGRLHNLSDERIELRMNELVKLLELPPLDRMVGHCSGGQQRRISMSITLLHDPKLLLLDEPTVGVDPILSHTIWEHFMELVNERGKTIIITTHYIEEARSANIIALMRGGVLLAEQPPDVLIQKYNADSLEQVFLKLSEKQETVNENIKPYPAINKNIPPFQSDTAFSYGRFKAQLVKNFNWAKRNVPVTTFVICWPAMLCAIVHVLANIHGLDQGDFPLTSKPLAFVNFEGDCKNSTEYLKLGKNCKMTNPISCRFLKYCEENFTLVEYHTLEDGIQAVRDNRARAVLLFEANFSQYIIDRVVDQQRATEKAIDEGMIRVWMDTAEYPFTVRIQRELADRIINIVQQMLKECGFDPRLAGLPMKNENPIYYQKGLLTNYLGPFVGAASSVVVERASGLFERSQVSGLTFKEIAAGNAAVQLLVAFVQNVSSFFIMFYFYSSPMNGSYLLAFILMIFIDISGMCFGCLLAVFVHSDGMVTYAGVATLLTLFMMCGTFWPLEGLHWVLVPSSNLLPVTLPAKAYQQISIKGLGITDPTVFIGFLSSIGFTLFYTIITVAALRFKIASISKNQ